MRTDKEIIKQLHTLQSVTPSERLRQRIALVGKHLPQHSEAGYRAVFPLRFAFAIAVFLLLVSGIGSGVVLSANKSKPGSFLFPVKKAVIQTQIHFTSSPIEKEKLEQEILQVTPTATPTPTPTVAPTETPEKHKDQKDVKGAEFPEVTITLTPAPQQHDSSHGKGNDSGQNFQNFFNRHEDDTKGSSNYLTNHEF